MTKPKYTFLLPAFKAKYFEEALMSIKNQTYRDFKVLVSDDCSPEDLKSIYDKVVCAIPMSDGQVEADPRFEYRRNEVNMGSKSLVSHWNLLVDMCDTEYLIMASDDDVYEPNFLEEIEKLTVKYPEVDLFRGKCRKVTDKGNILINDSLDIEYLDQTHYFYHQASSFLTCEANYCYKTKVLKNKGGYVEFPLAWFTDDATHIMMSEHGCSNTENIVFNYRVSDVTITNTHNNSKIAKKKVEAAMLFKEWLEAYSPKIPEVDEKGVKQIAIERSIAKVKQQINDTVLYCDGKYLFKHLKECSNQLEISKYYLIYLYLRKCLNCRS